MRIPLVLAVAACGSKPTPGVLNISDDADEARMVGQEVALEKFPGADFGFPITGAKIDVDLRVPKVRGKRDYTRATGFFALTCPTGCQLGDDKAKLVPKTKNRAFVGDGIAFGHIAIDRVDVRLEVADGHAKITRWIVESKDGAIDVDGDVTLAKDLEQSRIDACVRFKPSEALRQRDIRTYSVFSLMGAPTTAQGDFAIRITDRLDRPKMLGVPCGPGAS